MKDFTKLTKKQLVVELIFLNRAYEVVIDENKKLNKQLRLLSVGRSLTEKEKIDYEIIQKRKDKDKELESWVHHNISIWSYRNDDGVVSNDNDNFKWNESDWYALGECTLDLDAIEPIAITEEWLLRFEFEKWETSDRYVTEYENYDRYVLYNVIDGTSNFEVHFITSTYGDSLHTEFVCSIDEDERLYTYYDLQYVHQLQNLYFAITGNELSV